MITFAVVVLVIILIGLTVAVVFFSGILLGEEQIEMLVVMYVVYGFFVFLLVRYIIIWGQPLVHL